MFFFFFQAEDGIRDIGVTGVQTCALPICSRAIASQLQALGAAGDRALLLYPPGLDYLAAFFGCLYAGVVAVPAYPPVLNRPSSQVGTFVTDAGASWALTIDGLLSVRDQVIAQEPELGRVEWLATDTV